MNKKKLEEYAIRGSLHTAAIKCPGTITDIQEEVAPCVTVTSSQTAAGSTSTVIVNPNKLAGDVFNFGELQTAMDTIIAGSGINDYRFIRADLRLDSYDTAHYRAYEKLNRYLLSALAVSYRVKNCYRTTNLFNQRQLSVAVKNEYFEGENYDRAAKSELTENHAEPAKARLELRTVSKAWRKLYATHPESTNMKLLQKEFTVNWKRRWEKAIENLDAVQQRYNDELEKLYNADKDAFPRRFRSLTDFIIQYQDCIFTKKQLINFLSRFPGEVKNPRARAENHKKRYGIEYFSKKDVLQAIEEVLRATNAFFTE